MERVYKCFEVNKKYYVYDREINKILEVSEAEYEVLNSVKSNAEFETAKKGIDYFRNHFF